MAWDIHALVKDTNDENAAILNHIEDDVLGMLVAKKADCGKFRRTAKAGSVGQRLKAIPETEEISFRLRFSEGSERMDVDPGKVLVSLVGEDVISHARGEPWPPP